MDGTRETRESIVSFLMRDRLRNINMLNFMEAYPVISLERIGGSVLLRGDSDCRWVYVASDGEKGLTAAAGRLTGADRAFAAIEEWMVPALVGERSVSWHLSMVRLFLPDDVRLARGRTEAVPLSPDDAEYIYRHSLYVRVTRPDFIRKRIEDGPSAGVYEAGRLVAWLMTQDDGSIGVLHVLPGYRRRHYAYDLTAHMVERLRERERIPYVHIEEANVGSMALALALGFRKDRKLRWFRAEARKAGPTGDYC